MIIVEVFPICDSCNEPYKDPFYKTQKMCLHMMRKGGWQVQGGKHICPYCVQDPVASKKHYEEIRSYDS